MNISCYYSIMSTSKMDELLKVFEETGNLTLKHHIELEEYDYYTMTDKSGNYTDFIQSKVKKLPEGFFATRMNTDNFDETEEILTQNGYTAEGKVIETEAVKLALFVSKLGEPNVFVFEHKK